MKKILFNFLIVSAAGLISSASAQNLPPDTNAPAETNNSLMPPETDSSGMNPGEMPSPDAEDQPPGELPAPAEDVAPEPTMMPSTSTNAAGSLVILPAPAKPGLTGDVQNKFLPPDQPVGTNNPDALRMNFHNAPLDLVLNYLSDAAGFIIVLDTRVNGNVNVISSHPMTRDEAVNLLNSVLNKNGYAAIRNGRTLTIVDKNDAKTRNIPVITGNDPDQIPDNAEIVTQIIPVRFVEARQLVSDLTSFVSPQATVVANEAGNAIVITDTQSNIRHLMEIIRAIDGSAEAETEIRVFRLKYANPTDVATELGSVFPSSGSGSSGSQAPINFRGRGGFFQRMMSAQSSGGGSDSNDRIKKATSVTAVADARIQAVIVTAPKDLMEQIAAMMTDLDVASPRDQKVYVFHMNNGDPQQAVQVLQNMFQTSGTSRNGSSSSTQNSALMQRAQNNATSTGSSSSSSSGFGNSSSTRRSGGGGQQF